MKIRSQFFDLVAKKNENSVAVFRSSPDINPPIIVDADLETPGIKAKH